MEKLQKRVTQGIIKNLFFLNNYIFFKIGAPMLLDFKLVKMFKHFSFIHFSFQIILTGLKKSPRCLEHNLKLPLLG